MKSPKITSEKIVVREKSLYVPPHRRQAKIQRFNSSNDSWWRRGPEKPKLDSSWIPTHRQNKLRHLFRAGSEAVQYNFIVPRVCLHALVKKSAEDSIKADPEAKCENEALPTSEKEKEDGKEFVLDQDEEMIEEVERGNNEDIIERSPTWIRYRCPFCEFVDFKKYVVDDHCIIQHPDTKYEDTKMQKMHVDIQRDSSLATLLKVHCDYQNASENRDTLIDDEENGKKEVILGDFAEVNDEIAFNIEDKLTMTSWSTERRLLRLMSTPRTSLNQICQIQESRLHKERHIRPPDAWIAWWCSATKTTSWTSSHSSQGMQRRYSTTCSRSRTRTLKQIEKLTLRK